MYTIFLITLTRLLPLSPPFFHSPPSLLFSLLASHTHTPTPHSPKRTLLRPLGGICSIFMNCRSSYNNQR